MAKPCYSGNPQISTGAITANPNSKSKISNPKSEPNWLRFGTRDSGLGIWNLGFAIFAGDTLQYTTVLRRPGSCVGGSVVAMLPEGSVTRWIHELQAGDQAAAQELW